MLAEAYPECYHCVVVHCMLLRKSNRFSVQLYLYACCLLLSEDSLKTYAHIFKCYSVSVEALL